MRARFAIAVLVLACVVTPAMAQQSASIRGTITDEAGGLVDGATVTAIGADTGLTQETTTNASGFYNIGGLPIGLYILSAEKEGFSTAVVTDIQLNVNDVRQVNMALAVGAITDEITTEASAIVVETIGGEVAGLITGEQVRELPLNGRNFLQLTLLMPGVSAPDGFNTKNKGLLTGSDLSVSGGATTANMWTVDGASNNDVGSNRTILVYPSLEAIEEFKIHRNSYGAEFGGGGGAQINLVTRGGTNDLSGSVYMFQRRDSYNSTNALLREANQPKAPLERDDYGYTLGGPIKKDKFHFFLSQEWNDEARGVAVSGQVPTAAMKLGDFSNIDTACYSYPVDPLTGQPFDGNVIPGDRITPAGTAFLRLFPDANISGNCTNWVTAVSTPIDWAQINGRFDYTINSKHRALVRYTEDEWDNAGPTAGSANGLWGDDAFPQVDSAWAQPSDSLTAQINSVIGSSAINTLTFAQSGNAIDIGIADQDTGARQAIIDTYPTYFPASGKTSGGQAHPTTWGAAGLSGVWTQGPWYNEQRTDLYKDDYEQVFGGDHVIKGGVSYSENNKLETPVGANEEFGTLGGWGPWPGFATGYVGNNWGGNSGNSIADLLLEDMVYGFSERSASLPVNIVWEDLEVYAADSWKVRPNLTLDYGIRYSYFYQPYHDGSALYSNFNPDLFNPALGNAPCNGLMQQPGRDGCAAAGFPEGSFGPNAALINEDSDNFAPRLGMAWDIKGDGDSVLRAGFGQFFQRDRVSPHLGLSGNPPGVLVASGLRTLDGQFFDIAANPGGSPNRGIDINKENGYLLQYNLSWEQAIGRNSSIEVAYVGSRGKGLLHAENLNYVPSGDNDGNGQNDRLDFVQCPSGGDGDGCRSAYRVYGVYGNGDIAYWKNDGESKYDSIQTQYITRFGRGSQFQASYTLSDFTSKGNVAAADGGLTAGTSTTDPENPDLDWGKAGIHRAHVFNASLIHNLPTFEGEGSFKEWVLGNWSVGGIVSYSSGSPVLVTTGGFAGLPVAGGGAGFDNAQRPIRVAGEPCSGGGRQVLNPNAYTLTGYRLGEVSQMAARNDCDGPDFFQVDLSLYKNIPIGDRVNVQLRIEAFNIFDETNWVNVDATWDGAATLDSDTAPTLVTASEATNTFGLAGGARDAREVQIGVKVTF